MDLTRERFQALKDLLGTPANERNPIDKNNNATFPCLFCYHRKPKMTINLETEVYNCWVCQQRGMGIINLMKKIKVPIPKNYVRYFRKNHYNIDIDNLFSNSDKPVVTETKLVLPKGYRPLYINKNSFLYKPAANYLIKRGLTEDDFIKYDIQYYPADRRVLFPSYDSENNLNYYLSRAIYKTDFRYNNARVSKDNIIFNEHLVRWNEDVYIVEGVFDAIISRKNAIPILGSFISEKSYLVKRLTTHKHKVIFALDPDAKEKMFKTMKRIQSFGVDVSFVRWDNDNRDIAEMGSEEFDKKSLSGYTFQEEVLNKLGL